MSAGEQSGTSADASLRALIEQTPDALLVHRDGHILYANRPLNELLGYAEGELVGASILKIAHPRFHERIRERVRRVLERGVATPPLEQVLVRKDGSDVDVEIFSLPLVFEGYSTAFVHVRDLSEKRRLEAQLRTADRLASVGRLAATVGHEVNNPLTYVIGNLNAALALADDRGELRDRITEALDGADRVRRIVRDLKAFSQGESEERAPLDVHRVLDACAGMANNEIRHRARLVTDYCDVPLVLGSEARLGQVFLNLLLNAAQAIPEGAADRNTVTIATRPLGAGSVSVEIRDTGVGIPPELLGRVFEPFFTTKQRGAGTGLGLSICQSIVIAQGGEIAVESALGRGTTLRVALPVAPSDAVTPTAAAPVSAPRSGRKRILIVDDEPRVARTLGIALPEHDTTIAGGGREALELLASNAPFDLVLCDLMMPDLSGMDLYEQVKEKWPGMEERIAFMTGGAFTPRAVEFLATVPNDRLEKPFKVSEVEALLDACGQ